MASTPDRWPGAALFVCGLVIVVRGRRAWEGFGQGRHLSGRVSGRLKIAFRTPQLVSRWGKLKVAAWGLIAFRFAVHPFFLPERIAAAPERLFEHGRDAVTMLALTFLFPPFTRWIEPKEDQLQRLAARVFRAMVGRTLANFSGFCGVAVLLYTVLARFAHDSVKSLPALTLTIAVAMVVATHKMWTRYRRLCTQTHRDIQVLIRALERPPGGDVVDQRSAVLAAWDAVERDLRTRADTGYSLGTRFAPKAVTAAIGEAVDGIGQDLPGDQGRRRQVLIDLKIIQDVCADEIDSVA
ncbi:hypothetical protein OG389_03315 [Streptomyces sp. NBC_00435]|uniref:hypothetical protein n=1 Tax=Streptomyces sp. NBC_00435 TaxID=2903649 RepID=UPI002E21FC45